MQYQVLTVKAQFAVNQSAQCRDIILPSESVAKNIPHLITVHDGRELLTYVLGAAHGASLHEILVTPRIAELAVLPGLVDGQQCQVVSLVAAKKTEKIMFGVLSSPT